MIPPSRRAALDFVTQIHKYVFKHIKGCILNNNIKKYRNAKKLTQRQLADAIGTSQQQIQRIESGAIAANLQLANRIAAALGRSLSSVFPDAAKAIESVRMTMRTDRYLPDDLLESAAGKGIELDTASWYLKIQLNSRQKPLVLPVSPAEKRRLYGAIQEEGASPDKTSFVVFDSSQERIALNLRQVEFCQFLMEPWPSDEGEAASPGKLQFEFIGGNSVELSVEEDEPDEDGIGQVGNIFFLADLGVEPTNQVRIIDEEGEDAFIRLGSIALVRAPLWMMGEAVPPGMEDDEEEMAGAED